MVSTEFPSPNAIPPRISSTGLNSPMASPERSVLRPVTEADWISPGKKIPSMVASHSRHPSLVNASDSTNATWSPAKEKILRGPYEYLVNQPGKNIRKQLIQCFNAWLKVPEDRLDIINKVVAMLHTASLLVDDVEDGSELRRGIPVTHHIYGVAQTLNSANYMYFVALQELVKLNNPTVLHIYTEEMCNLHRGQGMDLFWRDTLTVPIEEEYLEMVGNKTGGLFRLAIKLMQAESKVQKDCVALVGLLGVIFQIRDDYINLSSTEYSKNKGMCEDLTEGKFSFPIIHSIRANPNSLVLINILKQKTRKEEVMRYAVGYMEQTGSFAYCQKVIAELIDKARGMIEELDAGAGEAEGLVRVLDKFKLN